MRVRTSALVSLVVLAVVLVAAGCSSDPEPEAPETIRTVTEALIEEQVTGPAGLGELTPACPEVDPTTAGVGTTFQCTATAEDQRVIGLTATIDDAGKVGVTTTNLITGPALPSFERAAVDALNDTVQSELDYSAIDCGEVSVVFAVDQSTPQAMVCALFDPLTNATYDVTLTMADIEARQFSLVVADEPRP